MEMPAELRDALATLLTVNSEEWPTYTAPEGTISARVPPGWEVLGNGNRLEGRPYTDTVKVFRFQTESPANIGRQPVPGDVYVDLATTFRPMPAAIATDPGTMAFVGGLRLDSPGGWRRVDLYVWREELPFGPGMGFGSISVEGDLQLLATTGAFTPIDPGVLAELLEIIRTAEFRAR